ncbi:MULTISPECIES: type VI secretion system baseplate subunit TssG [Caballeronia]|uniref:type VI secretion system baseplate subunit TssG n=1 Tax=Caballeronia TaxID=1827195 RepID=UPI003857E985
MHHQPWRYGFFPPKRRIARRLTSIRSAQLLASAPFRIGPRLSLAFTRNEIADARLNDRRPHIRLFGLSMLGPHGPLPPHITEIAGKRKEHREHPTLGNFQQIFITCWIACGRQRRPRRVSIDAIRRSAFPCIGQAHPDTQFD